eukprot:TRINITY_DN3286_c0_g1_i2.p1 TRINITY_DN3286_c0_g1~~TRINITY_DN3286_c0_g1_i2.p1  ORF type:complete len:1041 (-),score=173.71 TRINITY_DN3286_c0_g1_i2:514-3636(-)
MATCVTDNDAHLYSRLNIKSGQFRNITLRSLLVDCIDKVSDIETLCQEIDEDYSEDINLTNSIVKKSLGILVGAFEEIVKHALDYSTKLDECKTSLQSIVNAILIGGSEKVSTSKQMKRRKTASVAEREYFYTSSIREKLAIANATIYHDFSDIIATIRENMDRIRESKKNEVLAKLEENKKTQRFWEYKFLSQVGMVQWKTFYEALCTATPTPLLANEKKYIKYLLDPHGTGFVTPLAFHRFMSVFGPMKDMADKIKSICEQDWFRGYMDKIVAEKYMIDIPSNHFMIRFESGSILKPYITYSTSIDESPNVTTTTVLSTNPEKNMNYFSSNTITISVEINVTTDNNLSLAGLIKGNTEKSTFSSLAELANHFLSLGWAPSPTFDSKSYFYRNIPDETEAEKMLYNQVPGTFLAIPSSNQLQSFITFLCVKDHYNVAVSRMDPSKTALETSSSSSSTSLPLIPTLTKKDSKSGNEEEESIELSRSSPPTSLASSQTIHTKRYFIDRSSTKGFYDIKSPKVFYKTLDDFITSKTNLKYPFVPGSSVPFVTFTTPSVSRSIIEISGPEGNDPVKCSEEDIGVAVETVATYPKGFLGSEVLCDAFCIRKIGNRMAIVLCDGCSWGHRPRAAAQAASKEFCHYLTDEENILEVTNTETLVSRLKHALTEAHYSILSAYKSVYDAGTTTLVGGMLAKIESSKEYAFTFLSLGDCKVFHYDRSNKKLYDVTYANRISARNASDCGGRIGPCDGPQGDPDLRNLTYYFAPCNIGDLLIVTTDGLYDNLDPEHLGIPPIQVDPTLPSTCETWDSILNNEEAHRLKETYAVKKMSEILMNINLQSPVEVINSLIQHALKTTYNSRSFMENNPDKAEPRDYVNYPGKMDHTTCICVKVTDFDIQDESKSIKFKSSSWSSASPVRSAVSLDATKKRSVDSLLTQNSMDSKRRRPKPSIGAHPSGVSSASSSPTSSNSSPPLNSSLSTSSSSSPLSVSSSSPSPAPKSKSTLKSFVVPSRNKKPKELDFTLYVTQHHRSNTTPTVYIVYKA